MPVTASLIGGGVNLLGGLFKGLVGGGQKKKGNKILNGLQYPTEQVPGEEIENQNLARQQAATGLPSEQYANAMKNIQRQQLVALRGAQDRRGGLASIAGIQQGTNDATLNLDAKNAQMKVANQQNLMNTNNRLASWKDKVWQNNVMGKYNQQYNYGMGLLGAGNQNVAGGLDQATAGFGRIAAGSGGQNVASNYGKQNTPNMYLGNQPNYSTYG